MIRKGERNISEENIRDIGNDYLSSEDFNLNHMQSADIVSDASPYKSFCMVSGRLPQIGFMGASYLKEEEIQSFTAESL